MNNSLKITSLILLSGYFAFSYASSAPRLNVSAYSGNFASGAEGQLLIPFYNNSEENLFGIAEADGYDRIHNYMLSAGFGYRKIMDSYMFGSYVIADYLNSSSNRHYWFANPGIEFISNNWDLFINGYIKVANSKYLIASDWANNFGIATYHRFSGHAEYDHKAYEYEEVGNGFEAEIGLPIPYSTKGKFYLGGYHFAPNDIGYINGGKIRLTYEINDRVCIELKNLYDNKNHERFLVGIKLGLGDLSNDENDKQLFAPINHNLAIISPVFTNTVVEKQENQAHDNIYFFKPSESSNTGIHGSGTYEDPFIGFSPDSINSIIDPSPILYVASGNYDFNNFTSRNIENRFNLPNGWTISGRTYDFMNSAHDMQRPVFNGGIDMVYKKDDVKATTSLDSIILEDHVGGWNGISIYTENAANIVLNNVKIISENTNSNDNVWGIYANNSNIKLSDININVSNQSTDIDKNVFAHGIEIYKNSTLTFVDGNNTIIANAFGGEYSASQAVYADKSTVNIISGDNNLSVTTNNASTGIYASESVINIFGGRNNLSSNTHTVTNDSNYIQIAAGIYGEYGSTVNIYGGRNTINANGDDYGIGIEANEFSNININGGITNISASSLNNAIGILVQSDNSLIKIGNLTAGNLSILANSVVGGQYGIKVDDESHLQDATGRDYNPSNIDDLQKYFASPSQPGGNALYWDGIEPLSLEWQYIRA